MTAPHPAPAADPLMETRGLCYAAGGRRLLDGANVRIHDARRTVILGPNGAGKSLLLRMLHGLLEPTAGTILWNGTPMDKRARRAQAMVFQRPVMLRRSVMANLRFALKVRGVRGAQARAAAMQALDCARLAHLADRPARVLSGGEQQRLAVARALACDPEILFLDEPAANLDPASTLAIETQIQDANARGVTIVMVTHDSGQARRIAQDVVFLQDGRVAEAGPASRVLESPRSPAARAWLEGRLFVTPQHPT